MFSFDLASEQAQYRKTEQIPTTSLIRLGGTNFFNMRDASELGFVEASAPAWHSRTLAQLKAAGRIREDHVLTATPTASHVRANAQRSEKKFARGATCKTKDSGRRVTIIQASAGYTKKSHTPVHRVADSQGDVWLERETNLRLIY